MMMIGIL